MRAFNYEKVHRSFQRYLERSDTLWDCLVQMMNSWRECFNLQPKKKAMTRWILSPHWPSELSDPIPRVRFLTKAIRHLKTVSDRGQIDFDNPIGAVHDGLFRGDRWLYVQTWETIGSGQELYENNDPIPEKFQGMIRQMFGEDDVIGPGAVGEDQGRGQSPGRDDPL